MTRMARVQIMAHMAPGQIMAPMDLGRIMAISSLGQITAAGLIIMAPMALDQLAVGQTMALMGVPALGRGRTTSITNMVPDQAAFATVVIRVKGQQQVISHRSSQYIYNIHAMYMYFSSDSGKIIY